MVATVGRKKKDADRVNYNISRLIRSAVLKEADEMGWNEIDTIEELLKIGLTAKTMLKDGEIDYPEFSRRLKAVLDNVRTSDDQ
jgi:hypothetical protein